MSIIRTLVLLNLAVLLGCATEKAATETAAAAKPAARSFELTTAASVPPCPPASTRVVPSARNTGDWPPTAASWRGCAVPSRAKSAVGAAGSNGQPLAAVRLGATYSSRRPSGDQATGGNGRGVGPSRRTSAR